MRELAEVMCDAYVDRQPLEELFLFRLDRDLSTYVGNVGMSEVIFTVIRTARTQGWLPDLVDQFLTDRADNAAVQRWAGQNWSGGPAPAIPPPPVDHRLLDSTFFDLAPLKNRVNEVRRRVHRAVLGFGVHDADPTVVEKLVAWLPHSLGESECKDPLSLRPDLYPVDRQIKHALRYLPDLEYVNVICRVQTEGAPVTTLAAFWRGLCAQAGVPRHRFVVLFTGGLRRDTGDYPPDVERLPPPAVQQEDIYLWTQEVVSRRGWPPALADSWGAHLEREASIGAELDIRLLLEEIDKTTRRARQTPDEFRRHLEGLGRADAASR
ncbi:hypothetical protein GCM10010168_57580 [Actinoplanes ianthinogenes]|uniref:Effector-associated domain-containing protein n=1 Tax=Actinoplanes ianthinogenes TaxID=122358 RepID=A0ABM7M2H2_9ACTN|nr:hypothetical protein Aiant_64790 [Actinoplanes ianthinogenes]GGR31777.1 hypothetical protein GCM10010168_57580 [Actinoplanes ianthinogenes]